MNLATTYLGLTPCHPFMAGAYRSQLVSPIMRHGPQYFSAMRGGLIDWMESSNYTTIDQVRGALDGHAGHVGLFERGSYIRTLQSG